MAVSLRPDLTTADGVEVTDHLAALGWTAIQTGLDQQAEPPVLVVKANHASRDLEADLDAFAGTAVRGAYIGLLPLELRAHAIHLRDFGKASPAQIAALSEAEKWHVLKDVCRALAVLVDQRLD